MQHPGVARNFSVQKVYKILLRYTTSISLCRYNLQLVCVKCKCTVHQRSCWKYSSCVHISMQKLSWLCILWTCDMKKVEAPDLWGTSWPVLPLPEQSWQQSAVTNLDYRSSVMSWYGTSFSTSIYSILFQVLLGLCSIPAAASWPDAVFGQIIAEFIQKSVVLFKATDNTFIQAEAKSPHLSVPLFTYR